MARRALEYSAVEKRALQHKPPTRFISVLHNTNSSKYGFHPILFTLVAEPIGRSDGQQPAPRARLAAAE